jgi:cytoskeletal protein CcmA (bactofilin family)
MASTYVNDLRLNEMATGDASGSWGTVTNTNLELIGEAFSYGTETIGDADSTLTIADGAADAARSFYLKITSSVDLTTTRIVTLGPNTVSKVWMIENATTGSQVITIKQGSGATINVPNGQVKMISTDGAGSGGAVLDLLVDVDLTGTTTLVNLDVSGAVDIAGDLTLSAGGDGALRFTAASSVKVLDNNAAALVFEEADNAYMTFVTTDGSEAVKFDKALDINAATQIDATVTVGVDDTGYDVKFFGATAGAYMLWDESADDLILGGAGGLVVAGNVDFNGDLDVDGTTNLDVVDIDGAVDMASTLAVGGVVTANAGVVVDTITIDGSTITSSSSLILDIVGNLTINVDGTVVSLSDDTVNFGQFYNSGAGDFNIYAPTSDKDIVFKGNDGGTTITALTLDMSAAGAATFNSSITIPDYIYHTSDANTYFGFQGGDQFELETGGANRMSVVGSETVFNDDGGDKDFRVASDTNTHALFVDGADGNVSFGTSDGVGGIQILSSGSTSDITLYGASASFGGRIFFGDSSDRSSIQGGYDSGGGGYLKLFTDTAGGTNLERVYLDNEGGFVVTPTANGHAVFNEGGIDADFRVESATTVNALFVQGSDGNVGIGTGSPAALLHVAKSADGGVAEIILENSFTNAGSSTDEITQIQGRLGNYDASYIITGKESDFTTAALRKSYLAFSTRTATTGMTEKVRIDSTGGLITNPAAGGHAVFNEGGVDADFRVDSDTDTHALFVNGETGNVLFGGTADRGGKICVGGTTSTARILPQTDNVGYIGQSDFRWQAVYAINGTIQTSDEREKTEIKPTTLGLDFIKDLRPVSYKWIDGEQQDKGKDETNPQRHKGETNNGYY